MSKPPVEPLFEVDEIYTWTREEKRQILVVRKCTFCEVESSTRVCTSPCDIMLVDVQTKEVYPECMFRSGDFSQNGLRRAESADIGKLLLENI